MLASSVSQEGRRVDIVVDDVRIAVIGEIVHTEAPGPEVMQKSEPALKVQVDVEVPREPAVVGSAHQESFLIYHAKRKSSPVFGQIRDIRLANQKTQGAREQGFRNGRPAPGKKAIGRIPGQRPRRLPRENWILQVVVDDGVGSRIGAGIAAHPFEFPSEGASYGQLNGVITIVPPIAQSIQTILRDRRECRQRSEEHTSELQSLRHLV